MVKGPQVERLNKAVLGTDPAVVNNAAIEWSRCRDILETVSTYLSQASGTVKWAIGGETGPAVDAAFQRSAAAMSAKSVVLKDAVQALVDAGAAMHVAQQAAATMQDMDQPTPYTAPGDADDTQLAKEAKSKADQKAFAKAFAEQEEKARIEADQLEATFTKSAATMKKIHGEPDPPKVPKPAKQQPGGSNGGSSGGTTGHAITPTHLQGPTGHHGTEIGLVHQPHHTVGFEQVLTHHHHEVPTTTGENTTETPASSIDYEPVSGSASGSGLGSALGVGGATAGGMAAGLIGAKLTGALKGGLFPTSGGAAAGTAGRGTAASAVKGIGASARTGGAGTLGRSGAAAAGAQGKSAAGAGRSGAGAGAGRSGAGAGRSGAGAGRSGGRGGAGGRSGAGPTGRSGRNKDDEKGKKKELFDVAEDWIDDEGAAPGVLD
ncbi:hypothetical protein [Nocardioides conyzicola]|uniref:PPE domain-containing protein n=1 Tax=Nocardioides conyzicola TaxID=1651781 RepID=A0ABP8WZH5_9ACTN